MMKENEPAKKPLAWQPIVAAVLLAGGVGTVALSFVWARVFDARANWTTEQAREYQAAAVKLHSLSHEYAQQTRQGPEQQMRDKLEAAKTEYESLQGQLEAARARPANVALGLRLSGLALMAAGGVGLYRSRAVA